jgi:hypothetical protein
VNRSKIATMEAPSSSMRHGSGVVSTDPSALAAKPSSGVVSTASSGTRPDSAVGSFFAQQSGGGTFDLKLVGNTSPSQKDPLFDPLNIVSGEPVFIRKQMCYTGHASTTYSVEQAVAIIDWIGQSTNSEDFLPYAITLVEGGEAISIAEDNGEFTCGEIVGTCLKKIEGLNILVCVSRKTTGCFVADMLQSQKPRAVRDAATNALKALIRELKNPQIRKDRMIQRQGSLSSLASTTVASQDIVFD